MNRSIRIGGIANVTVPGRSLQFFSSLFHFYFSALDFGFQIFVFRWHRFCSVFFIMPFVPLLLLFCSCVSIRTAFVLLFFVLFRLHFLVVLASTPSNTITLKSRVRNNFYTSSTQYPPNILFCFARVFFLLV